MSMRLFIACGSVLAALAVSAGAMGAHLLEDQLSPGQLDTFRMAANYQLVHAVGLIAVGLVCAGNRSGFARLAGWLLLLGIVLFSGCLFAWVLTDVKFLVHLVPVGGTALIAGWIALAIAACRGRAEVRYCESNEEDGDGDDPH
jgi:uncharacterized membrane protein YgdD (TMEM256/DUF423 family)